MLHLNLWQLDKYLIWLLLDSEKVNATEPTKELNNKSTKISEQNSSIGLLLEKTSEFENEIQRLKKALKQTEKKLSKSQIHSNGLETKLQKAESDLRNKRKEIENNEAEIERLKNLKWYDKLVGKK